MNKIKIGIFGAGRGIDIARILVLLGCEIVALCDFNEKRRNEGLSRLNLNSVMPFDNFDDFIECETDAIVLANYFHELAPLMWSTGATPKKVCAMPVFSPMVEKVSARQYA